MRRWISGGMWATALMALGGLWIAGAPFWLGAQPAGAPWTAVAKSDVATGLGVFAVSTLGVFAHIAYALRDAGADAAVPRLAPDDGGEE